MTALILYDNTGKIWGVHPGQSTVPSGTLGLITEIENRPFKEITLDMSTNPPTPHITYDISTEDTENEVVNLQDVVIELESRVSALEG